VDIKYRMLFKSYYKLDNSPKFDKGGVPHRVIPPMLMPVRVVLDQIHLIYDHFRFKIAMFLPIYIIFHNFSLKMTQFFMR